MMNVRTGRAGVIEFREEISKEQSDNTEQQGGRARQRAVQFSGTIDTTNKRLGGRGFTRGLTWAAADFRRRTADVMN
jgi:hypothetical protein